MAAQIIGPTSHYFYSQRLKLHYVDWGSHDRPLAVLVHGGRDHCRNWDWVALELRDRFHIIAPDLRGHGDSDWAIGGSYSMIDYVLDVAQLIDAVSDGPVALIGHSLGGAIVLQYSGVFPDRVNSVVAIEGLGPPPAMLSHAPPHERMHGWIEEMKLLSRRRVREYPTIDAALERMRQENPRLTVDQARHLTIHGVRRNENGTFSWKFDNYVRAHSPYLFNLAEASAIWGRIASPCLLIRGDESPWAGQPETDGRQAAFRAAESTVLHGAGHWVHHDRLDDFMRAIGGFLKV